MKTADRSRGGFGRAPKFPQTFTIRFLLHYYSFTGNQEAFDQACLSLDKMIYGGIYDQLGGGFARYSTDEYWLAPHFEKMLYDNALLTITLSEACQIVSKPLYRQTVMHTLDFVERELLSPESGFYSALDADSEGVEGKFYVWDKKEIDALLGEQAGLFNEYYQVEAEGNWEHVNILHRTQSEEDFAAAKNIDPAWLKEILQKGRETLFARRGQRTRPLLDDKVLLGWNSLMNIAYSKAYAATGIEKYKTIALANMDFLLNRFKDGEEGAFFHSYKDGVSKYPAFLEDYALLIQALIHLQEITGGTTWLQKVKTLVKYVITHFSEPETGYFYFTNDQQQDVIVRKKELYDSAVPSGNSLMAWNLYYTGVIFDIAEWRQRAMKIGGAIKQVVQKYPGSFGNWATFMLSVSYGIPEIVLTGNNNEHILKEILRIFIPFRILQSSPAENSEFPLLAGKSFSLSPKIYLCKNFTCQSPVTEVDKLQQMLGSLKKYNS
ncbi:MAG: thioredoxin domain-containing protein [Chitinophagaceae bacterium]|nr:thioredoxin domain-containing protein [Chitinophagaceae bacterium]